MGGLSHPPDRPADDARIDPGEPARSLHHVDRLDPGGAAGGAPRASPDDRPSTANNPAATGNTWRRSAPMMMTAAFTRLLSTLGAVAIAAAMSPLVRTAPAQTPLDVNRRDTLRASTTRRDTSTAAARPEDEITTATRDFLATGVARVVRQGSFITFPYGHSQPTVTCRRLRARVIELEPGEIVLTPIPGEPTRWEVTPAAAGPDGRTTLVVVKPKDCDLTTNLLLATDRRIHDLTLDSPPCKASAGHGETNPDDAYTRHVRFYYPEQTVAQWAP